MNGRAVSRQPGCRVAQDVGASRGDCEASAGRMPVLRNFFQFLGPIRSSYPTVEPETPMIVRGDPVSVCGMRLAPSPQPKGVGDGRPRMSALLKAGEWTGKLPIRGTALEAEE